MTYIERAIEEAQSQGWLGIDLPSPEYFKWSEERYAVNYTNAAHALVFLDPAFWQALGKARGWGTEMTLIDEPGHPKEWLYYAYCTKCHEEIIDQEDGCANCCDVDDAYMEAWVMHWHRFIDHIAGGANAESFFKALYD